LRKANVRGHKDFSKFLLDPLNDLKELDPKDEDFDVSLFGNANHLLVTPTLPGTSSFPEHQAPCSAVEIASKVCHGVACEMEGFMTKS